MKQQRATAATATTTGSRVAGLAGTVLLHGIAVAMLIHYRPVEPAMTPPMPIHVTLVAPPAPVPPAPVHHAAPPMPRKHVKPPPKPVVRRPPPLREPTPITAAAPPAMPAPALPAPPEPKQPVATPAPETKTTPAVAERAPAPAPTLASARSAAETPLVAPSFTADYLRNPAPRYPPVARRMGQQGKVLVRVFVTASGAPDQVQLRSSSGYELLDGAALDAVRHWRFVPARRAGQPVPAWVLVPITFTLQG